LRGVRTKRRFLPEYVKAPGEYESSLTIRTVAGFEVDEPEQIGVYGIDHLAFDGARLTIAAGPSCTMTLEVDDLNVEAELRMRRYDWTAPGATALVVPIRAADPVIGDLRQAHTPSGREGMPAHTTLLAPFIHSSRLDRLDRHRLRDIVARFPAFDLRLSSFGVFERIGCLWLDPRPRDPFVAMTEALLEVYPEIDYPPEGATEIVPHVTIGGRLTEEQQEQIKRELAGRLPIRARADRAVLYERGANGLWIDRYRFRLKA
jgi:2'-5' RNA ligase